MFYPKYFLSNRKGRGKSAYVDDLESWASYGHIQGKDERTTSRITSRDWIQTDRDQAGQRTFQMKRYPGSMYSTAGRQFIPWSYAIRERSMARSLKSPLQKSLYGTRNNNKKAEYLRDPSGTGLACLTLVQCYVHVLYTCAYTYATCAQRRRLLLLTSGS